MKTFKTRTFHYCFNCGWGECGVHEHFITFQQAYDIIVKRGCKEQADVWETTEDPHFCFGYGDYYMVADDWFDAEDWEGDDGW